MELARKCYPVPHLLGAKSWRWAKWRTNSVDLLFSCLIRRTLVAHIPWLPRKKIVPQSKQSRKKTHFPTKVDVRLAHETSDELQLIADFQRRSKSETIREIIEGGVRAFGKDQSYRRYLRNIEKMQKDESPAGWLSFFTRFDTTRQPIFDHLSTNLIFSRFPQNQSLTNLLPIKLTSWPSLDHKRAKWQPFFNQRKLRDSNYERSEHYSRRDSEYAAGVLS